MVSKDGIGGDAWILAFNEAEQKLIDGANRKVVLSGSSVNIGRFKNPHIFSMKKLFIQKGISLTKKVLKTLRELHLDMEIINSNHLCNLLLSECEKHPNEEDWAPEVIGDRIVGILLQVFICGCIVVGDRCWRRNILETFLNQTVFGVIEYLILVRFLKEWGNGNRNGFIRIPKL